MACMYEAVWVSSCCGNLDLVWICLERLKFEYEVVVKAWIKHEVVAKAWIKHNVVVKAYML